MKLRPPRKTLTAIVTAIVVGAGSSVALTAAPASAAGFVDGGGTLTNGSWTTYAYMTKKVKHVQVRAIQICTAASGQTEFLQYGPWVSYPRTSRTASCPKSRQHGSALSTRYV